MTVRIRSQRVGDAAVRQTPLIVVGTILAGFGYLAALIVAGRPVTVWDLAAGVASALLTGAVGVWTTWSMARAAQAALDRRPAQPRPTQSTATGLPVVVPAARLAEEAGFPSYEDDPEAAVRAMQERVNRARPARTGP